MKQLILASTSPRRKEIFEKTGLPFAIEDSNFSEELDQNFNPSQLAERLSFGKAEAVAERHKNAIVIGADTIVVLDGKILGKPGTPEKAREMLHTLQGRSHKVITGVTVIDAETGQKETFSVETKVCMKKLSETEIEQYVVSGEPLDKAGAYAIQGLGAVLIEKIEGDFFNVMGLPLSALVNTLKEFDVHVI